MPALQMTGIDLSQHRQHLRVFDLEAHYLLSSYLAEASLTRQPDYLALLEGF